MFENNLDKAFKKRKVQKSLRQSRNNRLNCMNEQIKLEKLKFESKAQ